LPITIGIAPDFGADADPRKKAQPQIAGTTMGVNLFQIICTTRRAT
jgi:hypothetical protein